MGCPSKCKSVFSVECQFLVKKFFYAISAERSHKNYILIKKLNNKFKNRNRELKYKNKIIFIEFIRVNKKLMKNRLLNLN